jgi:hypothetical protein
MFPHPSLDTRRSGQVQRIVVKPRRPGAGGEANFVAAGRKRALQTLVEDAKWRSYGMDRLAQSCFEDRSRVGRGHGEFPTR